MNATGMFMQDKTRSMRAGTIADCEEVDRLLAEHREIEAQLDRFRTVPPRTEAEAEQIIELTELGVKRLAEIGRIRSRLFVFIPNRRAS